MSIRIHIEPHDNWVVVHLSGSGRVSDITRRYPQIVEACERARTKKLLIDFSRARTLLSLQERYALGNQAVIFARNGIKVAAVAAPAQLDPEQFGAIVARNRGVDLGMFTDIQTAEAWLAEE